jgi:hypothetical protein
MATQFADSDISASYRRIAARWAQLAAEAQAEVRAQEGRGGESTDLAASNRRQASAEGNGRPE